MVRTLIIFMTGVLFIITGLQGEGAAQQLMPGIHASGRSVHNMGMMSEMMRDMQQLMSDGRMTPEQQREMSNMMDQMSQMMREMLTPQAGDVAERHRRQLQEMQRRLKVLKKEVQKQKKGQVQPNPEEHEH